MLWGEMVIEVVVVVGVTGEWHKIEVSHRRRFVFVSTIASSVRFKLKSATLQCFSLFLVQNELFHWNILPFNTFKYIGSFTFANRFTFIIKELYITVTL